MSPWVFAIQSLGQVRSYGYYSSLGYMHDRGGLNSKSFRTSLDYDYWVCLTVSLYTMWFLDSE